jgi:hypothetical protein
LAEAWDVVVDRDAGHSPATAQISGTGVWGAAMDVGGWLRGLGLGQYETNFRDNKIDADLLPRLTEDRLKDMGSPLLATGYVCSTLLPH